MGRFRPSTRRKIRGLAFVCPCMIMLIVMMAYPVIQTVVFSFCDITLPKFDVSFSGVSNFTRVFSKPEIAPLIKNTIIWTLFSVVLRISMGMAVALVMNSEVRGIGFFRLLVLLPWTIPTIVSANAWRWMLQGDYGVINGTLRAVGLPQLAMSWLSNVNTAMPSVLMATVWAGYPFVMMMLLSAMQGLPKEQFEAAMIDGANAFQRFWYIVIPNIKPVLYMVIVLETISAINSFDMLYTMTGGGPGGATEIFGLFIYRLGFTNLDFSGAAAVSVVLILIAILGFCLYVPMTAQGRSGKRKGG